MASLFPSSTLVERAPDGAAAMSLHAASPCSQRRLQRVTPYSTWNFECCWNLNFCWRNRKGANCEGVNSTPTLLSFVLLLVRHHASYHEESWIDHFGLVYCPCGIFGSIGKVHEVTKSVSASLRKRKRRFDQTIPGNIGTPSTVSGQGRGRKMQGM